MTSTLSLFDRLVMETHKLLPAPIAQLSKGHLKRWDDLAAHWEAYPAIFPNLFFEAIFHIARNRYSKASDATKPLLSAIVEAMLTDSAALSVWKKRTSFRLAYSKVSSGIKLLPDSKQRWKTVSMRCYASTRLHMLLMYNATPLPELTLKTIVKGGIYWKIRKQLEIQSDFARFEELIELLVPDCRKWSPAQWTSEKYIFSRIKAAHGVDFSQDHDAFDALVRLYQFKAEGIPYYRTLFCITDMAPSIAHAIWPVDMEKEICRQFNYACNVNPYFRYRSAKFFNPLAPKNIAGSWAFKQMGIWRKATPCKISKKTQSKMLMIGLGLHPWVEKQKQDEAA